MCGSKKNGKSRAIAVFALAIQQISNLLLAALLSLSSKHNMHKLSSNERHKFSDSVKFVSKQRGERKTVKSVSIEFWAKNQKQKALEQQ